MTTNTIMYAQGSQSIRVTCSKYSELNILTLARFEPTTSTTTPSITPNIDATNYATKTSPKVALILTTPNAIYYLFIFFIYLFIFPLMFTFSFVTFGQVQSYIKDLDQYKGPIILRAHSEDSGQTELLPRWT